MLMMIMLTYYQILENNMSFNYDLFRHYFERKLVKLTLFYHPAKCLLSSHFFDFLPNNSKRFITSNFLNIIHMITIVHAEII